MGSSTEFLQIFAAEPDAVAGVPFARFMELALFHPQVGYYARSHPRIGRTESADFYTATSLGPVFGELVVSAAVKLLGAEQIKEHAFVEIGAEPDGGVLREVRHPFATSRTISLDQPVELSGDCVVFSNELFDAQPCHRLVRRVGAWRETGVAFRKSNFSSDGGALVEVELSDLSPEVSALSANLPADAPEGYRLDLPVQSVALLRAIAGQRWRGLFLAFDYGRTWHELTSETPQGSVRAYSRQQQSNDLLGQPGEQDLTCHVCWDWLAGALSEAGFSSVHVESQESFLAHHAAEALSAIVTTEARRFSPRKQALLHLLQPGQMGQKFQVIHGLRR
jgi:SAM-dependent MidA family methyltransferase